MPNSPPRVTVLMTVYNGMPYLKEAIQSLLGQTFSDFELLIIDDASTDGSSACIESFRDPRIRLVRSRQNRGQADSLNQGLSLASSPYIARMDQDDVSLPDRLAAQVSFLDAHPDLAAAGSWLYWVDSNGRKTGVTGLRIEDFGSFLGILLGQATPVGHPTAMFRREVFAAVGTYDPAFAPCEDYELWCRIALRRYRAGMIPRPLLMLRLHDRQQSATKLTLQQEQAKRAHLRLISAFLNGGRGEEVASLLRMESSFWAAHPSSKEVAAVCEALEQILLAISTRFQLNRQELAHLRLRISCWIARAAFLAILKKQRQSLAAYRQALRAGWGILSYPPLLIYPFCFLLSPLFFSAVGRAAARSAGWLNRQRYVARLMIDSMRTG
ncbi:MAG: glycosyltransferase [Candidatus Omnitrophica bacterium]|nr:glycosyltransferase [Candidatus Omnitrophota bacterium]